jgi:hypothetical protein
VRDKQLLETIQKLYKLLICHRIDIDHVTLFMHIFSIIIKSCSIYFNSGSGDQAENYLCLDCYILSVMVG